MVAKRKSSRSNQAANPSESETGSKIPVDGFRAIFPVLMLEGVNDTKVLACPRLEESPVSVDRFTARPINSSIEGIDATQERSGSRPSVSRKKGRPGKKSGTGSLDDHALMAGSCSQSTNSREAYSSQGDSTAQRNGGSGFSVVKGRRGRRRGARSMGRFPFRAAVNDYMVGMKGVLAASTWKELERRYKRMEKDLQLLHEAGKVSSLHPEKINEQDVLAYLSCLRARGLKEESVSHNLITFCSVLRFSGNAAVDRTKMKYPQHFPKFTKQRLDPINGEDRLKIIEAADKVPSNDWRRMLGYAIAVAGICSGLRPGELRKAKISEIDLDRGVMHAEEVKGKGRYGEPRNVALHPDGIPFLRRYLHARAAMISKKCPTNEALFPRANEHSGADGLYTQQGFSRLRLIVQKETEVIFDGRATRRTYGQTGIDQGVPIDAISRMLGHSSTKTTEKYYCRRSNEAAIAEARKVWGQPAPLEPQLQKGISPLIEKNKWLPGYA